MATKDPAISGGGKLATRVSEIVNQGIVATHANLAGVKRGVVASMLDDFFDKVSGEVRHTAGPILAPIANHPDTPDTMRPLFQFLATGNGQWQSILGQQVMGAAVGTGIGTLLTNTLQPVTGRLVAESPNMPISVADAARAQATGFVGSFDMRYEAMQQGVASDKFDLLVELARPRLGPPEVLDLWNRGILNDDFFHQLLREAGYGDTEIGFIKTLGRTLIDPARLADLVTRGVIDQAAATDVAKQSGLAADDFAALVLGNGEPPGTEQLLFAYRRKIIDEATLLRGIRQSRVRNEWFDVIQSLGQVPMSTADAIDAMIKGHITPDQAQTIAEENGLLPEQFAPLAASAGAPPGPREMLDLLNRGLMTEAEVIQGLKESRLNNKYIPAILASRTVLPTEPQILSMIKKGVITQARGKQLLQQRGYPDDLVNDLIAEATQGPTETVKALSLTAIRALYLDKAITRDQAVARIQALKFTNADAQLEVGLIDEQRDQRYITAVINRVHREYVEGLLTDQEVPGYLAQLEVDPDQGAADLAIWQVEKATVRRSLTETQIAQALKKGIITQDEAVARWQGLGYSAGDAGILLAINTPAKATPAGQPQGA